MKFNEHEPEEVKLEMTSMIDIVFQLLVFFIMTFKVVAMEGDFNIRMPLASVQEVDPIDEVLPGLIVVQLKAGANGAINKIVVDDKEQYSNPDMYQQLTRYVEGVIAAEGDAEKSANTEVEFDIDYALRYGDTVRGIEAVSGKIVGDNVVKLIEKIKFKDNTADGP
jgi:biopolymer transport protein ExbD